jgi:hypothetical protein
MMPVLSSEGEKINWINYRTGEKDIAFRMDADNRKAFISIELCHRDQSLRQLYFEQFLQFRSLLENTTGEKWNWQPDSQDLNGRACSVIFTQLEAVSIFNRDDWPALISFFKPRIIALDSFWTEARYTFEALRY